jgi:hypothetical protein
MTSKTTVAALALSAATLTLLAGATGAGAASTTQPVSGTALETIAIAVTPAAFTTNFRAGSTATTTGVLTATDTNASWSLAVHDTATSNPGHMGAAALGCSGSEAKLENPLSVSVTSVLEKVTSAGAVSISGSPQTVASSTSQPLAAAPLTTNYSQTINSGETLLTGCVYSLTATYTLQ